MKKRLISFFMALAFVFSFPVVASANAATVIVSVLLEKTIGAIVDKTVENLEDGNYLALVGFYNNQVSKHFDEMSEQEKSDFLHSYYQHMQNTGEFDPVTNSTGWASNLKPIEFYLQMAVGACWNPPAPAFTTGNYHYIIYAVSDPHGYYRINVKLIYDTNHYTDWNYHLDRYNCPSVDRGGYPKKFDFVTSQIVDDTPFGGTNCSVSSASYYTNEFICNTNVNPSASDIYCYATDFLDAPLTFSAQFSVSGNNLNISLDSNRPVTDDLKAVAGILYDDGTHTYDGTDRGYINADFINGQSLLGSQHWEWSYNLSDFSNWAYRKRIFNCDCFYGFVHVLDGSQIKFADQSHLSLPEPIGIFKDVQPMPDPDDYKPTPSPFPTFPDVSFDYTPSSNYTTYNYDTVNNYDTTQNFNEWLGDTITTINNNLSGGLDNLSHNISVTGDNIKNFTEEFKNYAEGSSSDICEYLGDLIKKFNTDFNNWTDSFSKYLGDLFQTLNDNITVIGDNIVQAIQIQTIPDQDVVLDIMISNCDWFKQGYDILKSRSSVNSENEETASNMVVELPLVGDTTFTVDYNSYLGSEYCQSLRSFATIIIYASTFIGALNIIFKIFGLGFGSTDD